MKSIPVSFPAFRTVAAALILVCAGCADTQTEPLPTQSVTRSAANPLLSPNTPGNVDEWGYPNINGPSVIRVPDWVEEPLGRYYLYFAHHRGSFIRMAWANDIEGPWTIKEDGVLHLADVPALDHVASPDVIIDEAGQRMLMFYHSVDDTTDWTQTTYLATSEDGLRFEAHAEPKGLPYLRTFTFKNQSWGLAKIRYGPGGALLKADAMEGPYEEGPVFIDRMRHGAVLVRGDSVDIVFSRIGDSPERLLVTTIDPVRMWTSPYEPTIRELMTSEMDYEGADLPADASAVGEETGPVHALRDPHLFQDEGRTWLFYSVAGENGIGVAEWRR